MRPALLALPLLLAAPALAGPADTARDALELHYAKRKIYSPVACDRAELEARTFVFCRAVGGGKVGGLYLVSPDGIAPVNGKAKQHVGGSSSIEAVDGKPIPVVATPPELAGRIPSILEAF